MPAVRPPPSPRPRTRPEGKTVFASGRQVRPARPRGGERRHRPRLSARSLQNFPDAAAGGRATKVAARMSHGPAPARTHGPGAPHTLAGQGGRARPRKATPSVGPRLWAGSERRDPPRLRGRPRPARPGPRPRPSRPPAPAPRRRPSAGRLPLGAAARGGGRRAGPRPRQLLSKMDAMCPARRPPGLLLLRRRLVAGPRRLGPPADG